jgi:hypothetical protein
MKMKQSLLWQSTQIFPDNPNFEPSPISNTDLRRAIGLYFNLSNIFKGTVTPNTYNSAATANIIQTPFVFPVAQVNVQNFAINVDYTAVKGGSGTGFSGTLNVVIAPCSIDTTIDQTLGTDWAIGSVGAPSTYLSLPEDYAQTINSDGAGQFNRFSNWAASSAQTTGTFCFGYWFGGLTNIQAGDTFDFNRVTLILPGTVGGE